MAEEFSGFSNQQVRNAATIKDSMAEINNLTKLYNKALGTAEQIIADVATEYRGIKAGADEVKNIQEKAAKSSAATAKAFEQQSKQLNIVARLNARIDRLYKAAQRASGDTKENLINQARVLGSARDNAQSLANSFGQLAEDSNKLTKSNYVFSNLAEIAEAYGSANLARPFSVAAEAARQVTLENAKAASQRAAIDEALKTNSAELTDAKLEELGLQDLIDKNSTKSKKVQLHLAKKGLKESSAGLAGIKAGAKAIGPALSKAFAPLAIIQAIAKGIKLLFDAMFAADAQIVGLQRSLGLTKESAKATKELYMEEARLARAKGLTNVTAEKLIETNDKLNDSLGLSVKFGADITSSFVTLTERFRISEATALKLLPTLAAMGGPVDKTLESMEAVVGRMRMAGETAMGFDDVLNAIGETSNLMKVRFGGSAESLVRSVTAARRLGMSLDEAHNMGKGLNDVQESFVAQSNLAAVGLGDINVQRALELKAQGKSLQATQEIYKQFQKIPYEMRKMPHIQEMFNKAFGANIEQIEENLQKRREELALGKEREKNLTELEEYEKKLLADLSLSNQERERLLKLEADRLGLSEANFKSIATTATAQEEFASAMAALKSEFVNLVQSDVLSDFTEVLRNFTAHLSSGGSIMGGLLGFGSSSEEREADFTDALEKFDKDDTNQQRQVTMLIRRLGKDKVLTQQNIDRLINEQGIDKALIKNTIDSFSNTSAAGNSSIRKAAQKINVEDFQIKTHPKDTLVMAGGTRFGEETNKLLRELIATVREGGDVVMDGNKVGYTLSMAGSKF
jgi:hypothetical protein